MGTHYTEQLYHKNGVPVADSGNGGYPQLGLQYYVDITNGNDGRDGRTPDTRKKTIQSAVSAQIADTDGCGDEIFIAPGTYAESVVASELTNVKLIGYSANSVIIAPTDSHALLVGTDGATAATMTNSLITGITFLTPSTSNVTYAAATICYMVESAIQNCKFKGTTNTGTGAAATTGLRIGNETDTGWEFHEHSRISNLEFTSNAGRTTQLGVGIHVGANTVANPERKGFKSMIIEDCLITAKDRGIRMGTGATSCGGTILRRNAIMNQEGGGPGVGIQSMSTDGTDMLCMIHDNRIVAITDGILNFTTGNVQGNIVSLNGATPAAETA